MESTLEAILISVGIVSLISLVGVFTIFFRGFMDRFLHIIIAFAAGTLLATAFFDMLPEALATQKDALGFVLGGILLFFIIERFIYWHHHHAGEEKEIHPFTYLNLLGDGVHNFIDGAVIAATYLTNFKLGVVSSIAIALHEIPQEFGDFGLLVYGGFSKAKALFFNFLTALTAVVGALAGYYFFSAFSDSLGYLLAIAGGGFIYIASSDLIPELHKEKKFKESLWQLLAFLIGIVIIYIAVRVLE